VSFFRLSAVVSAFAAVLFPLSEIGFAQNLSGASIAVEADWPPSGYMGLGGGLAWVIALRDAEKLVAENSVSESTVAETPAIETSSVDKSVETSSVETGAAEKPGIETSSVETPAAGEAPVSESAAADSPVTAKPAAAPRPPRRARSARNVRRMIDNWTPIAFVAQTLDHTGMNIASLGMHAGLR
jgi:hypothetical protein